MNNHSLNIACATHIKKDYLVLMSNELFGDQGRSQREGGKGVVPPPQKCYRGPKILKFKGSVLAIATRTDNLSDQSSLHIK